MSASSPVEERTRYRDDPSVLSVLKRPRLLTREVLAGLVVGLALIPEAIAFSVIAGVFQILLGVLGVAKLMRFIPRSVMTGFVNALAIFVFSSQIPHLVGVPWLVYPLVVLGILVMIAVPRLTKVIPAPLISVVIVTAVVLVFAIQVPTVGDQGELPETLPSLFLPNVPLTWETFTIIAPFALGVAVVGLMESLMTAKLVDEITDTHSDKTRESWGQGAANVLSGFFGGMGGCAMIGQTMINVRVSGARTRLSTFLAGAFLMVLCVVFGPVVSDIPMAALVAVMVMVSVGTFDWHSIAPRTLKRMPAGEITVMVVTVACVVATHNLAIGVVVGSLTAVVIFAKRVAHRAEVTAVTDPDGTSVVYRVTGELFFASSNDLVGRFRYATDPARVVVDLSAARIWDASSVAALDAVEAKYAQRGKSVEIIGLNEPSARMHRTLSGELTGGH